MLREKPAGLSNMRLSLGAAVFQLCEGLINFEWLAKHCSVDSVAHQFVFELHAGSSAAMHQCMTRQSMRSSLVHSG